MSCNDYKHICPNYKLFYHNNLCEKCRGKKFYQAVLNKCCHDSITYSVASALEYYYHEKMNLLRKNVDLFLFASDFMAKKTEDFWGKNTFKWRKLINPIKIETIKTKNESDDYILFFGRLVEEKGLKDLLLAMDNLPKIKLVVVGDGPERKESTNNVQFVGEKWGEEMNEIIDFWQHIEDYGHIFHLEPKLLDEPFKKIIEGISEIRKMMDDSYSM